MQRTEHKHHETRKSEHTDDLMISLLLKKVSGRAAAGTPGRNSGLSKHGRNLAYCDLRREF